jgi:hypothetical protein
MGTSADGKQIETLSDQPALTSAEGQVTISVSLSSSQQSAHLFSVIGDCDSNRFQ